MQALIIDETNLKEKIYTLRDTQVMLDRDLAELYGVSTKVFNQAVKRNIQRFPEDFRFQLSQNEFANWRSQIVTSSGDKMGLRHTPYAFTEQGISMLSAILKSDIAIDVSVKIIRLFVQMRQMVGENYLFEKRLELLETKQHKTDENVQKLLGAFENRQFTLKEGIFFEGEVFDAYIFITDLIKSAKSSLVLFDNYIDETILTLFSKVETIDVTIYTHALTKQLKLDLEKYNEQYSNVTLKTFKKSHDRFLIIDEKEVYHIGASLKDLGKKWFAFSKMDSDSINLLQKVDK